MTSSDSILSPIRDAFFLTGPTAGGKTQISIHLSRMMGAEIISLDSMAVYRYMNIGTAKPTPEEQGGVPHHLIDVRDPWEEFSLADYLKAASEVAKQIRSRGKKILFVGGTPLYLKAALCGIFEGPQADLDYRAELSAKEKEEPGSLYRELARIAPDDALRLHPNDTRRLIRALEVFRATGKSISSFQNQFQKENLSGENRNCGIVLTWDRPVLNERINQRVDTMMEDGFSEEVQRLDSLSFPLSKTALQGVGYTELLDFLHNRTTLSDAVERIKLRTRHFAKRQETWFRSLSELISVPMSEPIDPEITAEKIFQIFCESGRL